MSGAGSRKLYTYDQFQLLRVPPNSSSTANQIKKKIKCDTLQFGIIIYGSPHHKINHFVNNNSLTVTVRNYRPKCGWNSDSMSLSVKEKLIKNLERVRLFFNKSFNAKHWNSSEECCWQSRNINGEAKDLHIHADKI